MSARFALCAAILALTSGCGTVWNLQDDDGDGISAAEGDCWDQADGPPGSGLKGSDIYPGAPDLPYDGIDADCAGNDDYDLDNDGWVPLQAHIGLSTLGVPDSGANHLGAGDCFDAPNDIVTSAFEADLRAYASGLNALGVPVQVIAVPADVDTDRNGSPYVQLRPDEVNPAVADDPFYDGIDADCAGNDDFDQDGDGEPTLHHSRVDENGAAGPAGGDCIDGSPLDDPNPAATPAAEVRPGAEETYWDGTDQDCDYDLTRDCDYDRDGFRGDPTVADDGDSACAYEPGELIDCNDLNDSAIPDPDIAEIFYNGVDDNCTYALAGGEPDRDGDMDRDGFFAHDYCDRVPGGCEAVDTDTVTIPDLSVRFDCWDDLSQAAEEVNFPADAPVGYTDMVPASGFSALTQADVNSGAADRPYDGVDQDCGGWLGAMGVPTDFDWDGDGELTDIDYTDDASGELGSDCIDCPNDCYNGTATGDRLAHCTEYCAAQDPNPAGLSTTEIYSGAYDEWYDGTDADCDDWSDYDADRDGYDHEQYGGGDCFEDTFVDIYNPPGSPDPTTFNPGVAEIPGDEIDQDCDGTEICFLDNDDDGYRPDATSTLASANLSCGDTREARATEPTTDCDDTDAGDYPGATEIVGNEDDEDCDGGEICFLDNDDDGYRPNATATIVSADTDCQDSREATRTEPITDCDDDASTCTTDCSTDSDSDGFANCIDACSDNDDDNYGTTNSAAVGCVDGSGASCVADAACTATDCDDNASTCTTDCSTDVDADGFADCRDACDDDDDDNYGLTNASAVGCVTATGASCVQDAACTATDCNDNASTCTTDCTTDVDADGFADCRDACDDDDDDNYGVTNSSASSCVTASGASCVQDAACTATDCNDNASTCTTDCTTDSDGDGFADCRDACDDDDDDNYGLTNSAAVGCVTATGASCVQDAACSASDCDDNASTCTTDCSTDVDGDGFADCRDACDDDDRDNYGLTNSAAVGCVTATGTSCVQDAACTATDCNDNASTCTTDCTTDSDGDGFADCRDACDDDDDDNYGVTNSSASSCVTASGASCVQDAACTATDCNDNASTCTTDCSTDSDGDGFADCRDACDDDDRDNYGLTNSAAVGCVTASGASCVQDAACTATDCNDNASTCTTDCSTDSDGDGFADCRDACDDDDDDNYGVTNSSATSCVTASGASCVQDAACTATDCNDNASTCTTDCSTDSDGDGFADCRDACDDDDDDNYGVTNTAASTCVTATGASCVQDTVCTSTDCNDNASTCTTDCSTDSDGDGFVDCRDACDDDDDDNYGTVNAGAAGCLTASGASCIQDAACLAPDCNDDASTCTTDCSTDSDGDGFVDCRDACDDDDRDNYGNTNSSATSCLTSAGASCVQDAACTATDCNDSASTCTTVCTGDSDGDGFVDCLDGCTDVDLDDYGMTNSSATSCSTGSGACAEAAACLDTDCDDTDVDVNPGLDEGVTEALTIDAVDNDCDDIYDEYLIEAGDLLITEIMVNPTGSVETDTEWFEIYNNSGVDLILGDGWSFTSGSASHVITTVLPIEAGGYLLFARNTLATNHGLGTILEDFEYGTGGSSDVSFSNSSADSLEFIFDSYGGATATISSRSWGTGSGISPSSGASIQLDLDGTYPADPSLAAGWCNSTQRIDSNPALDFGSPGSANEACP